MVFAMAAAILALLYPAYIGFRQLLTPGAPVTASMEVIHLETAMRGAAGAIPANVTQPKGE